MTPAAESKFQPYSQPQFLPEHLRPLGDRVLIRHLSHAEKIGSIIIPEISREKSTYTKNEGFLFRGVVVAVGGGANYLDRLRRGRWVKVPTSVPITPDVAVGDIVLFERRREAEVAFNGEMFSLVSDSQSIMAIEDAA